MAALGPGFSAGLSAIKINRFFMIDTFLMIYIVIAEYMSFY